VERGHRSRSQKLRRLLLFFLLSGHYLFVECSISPRFLSPTHSYEQGVLFLNLSYDIVPPACLLLPSVSALRLGDLCVFFSFSLAFPPAEFWFYVSLGFVPFLSLARLRVSTSRLLPFFLSVFSLFIPIICAFFRYVVVAFTPIYSFFCL